MTINNTTSLLLLVLLVCCCSSVQSSSAFVAPSNKINTRNSALSASSPRFNMATQEWEYTSKDQEPSAGYDTVGTLLRHGPKPWFNRVFQTNDYEQAVLKYMAVEQCDRNEAQGNMDAYLRNPNDWAYFKGQKDQGKSSPDYTALNSQDVALTITWSVAVFLIVSRIMYSLVTGDDFWEIVGLHTKTTI